jgi:transcriptional regulator with XRE-family HTH domain
MTLKNQRNKHKLTTETMARQLGISRGYYSHLENGTRPFTQELIIKVSRILNLEEEVVIEFAKETEKQNASPNSWVMKIKIDNKPWLEALKNDIVFLPLSSKANDEEIIDRAVKFISYRIEHSLRQETTENIQLRNYIIAKLINCTTTNPHRLTTPQK